MLWFCVWFWGEFCWVFARYFLIGWYLGWLLEAFVCGLRRVGILSFGFVVFGWFYFLVDCVWVVWVFWGLIYECYIWCSISDLSGF